MLVLQYVLLPLYVPNLYDEAWRGGHCSKV